MPMNQNHIVCFHCRAIGVGILKVMAKMGISTLASYKGAQIFEVRCQNILYYQQP